MLLSIVSIRNKTVRNMSINIIYNCSYKFHYGNILWLQKILCIRWFLKNILDVICLFPFSLSLVSSYTRDVYMLDKPLPNTLVHHNLNPSNLAWLDLNLRIRKEKLRLDWIVIYFILSTLITTCNSKVMILLPLVSFQLRFLKFIVVDDDGFHNIAMVNCNCANGIYLDDPEKAFCWCIPFWLTATFVGIKDDKYLVARWVLVRWDLFSFLFEASTNF